MISTRAEITDNRQRLFTTSGIMLGVMATFVTALLACYSAGLSGPFVLDDFANLEKISLVQGELSWKRVVAYLNAGISGPTGRPLPLLTFLMDSPYWPTLAEPFKRTNVLLHALNGLFVFWLSLLLLTKMKVKAMREEKAVLVAALAALLWTFSPYHTSTVLYVVQRMAILSATFSLLGLILYFKGRDLLARRFGVGLSLIMLGYVCGVLLSVFSKENGALFVLMVPLFEWLWFGRGFDLEPRIRQLLHFFIALPVALLALGFIVQFPSFFQMYEHQRDFSLIERLLTQARAVGYYLWRYLIPGTEYAGVYADGIRKSVGFFSPPSTAAWTLAHALLVASAVRWRHRFRIFSFGILFFYVGHLMESTIVPLELMFEHRNYLASVFLLIGLASFLSSRKLILFFSTLLVLNVVCLLNQVDNWRSVESFASAQLEVSPSSARAVTSMARLDIRDGEYESALATLRQFLETHPPSQAAAFLLIATACQADAVDKEDVGYLLSATRAEKGKPGSLAEQAGALINAARNGRCKGIDYNMVHEYLAVYSDAYPRSMSEQHEYHVAMAKLSLAERNFEGFKREGFAALHKHARVDFIDQFCSVLGRVSRKEHCSCLQLGEKRLLEGTGITKTFVRVVSGYEQAVLNDFVTRKARVCAEEPMTVQSQGASRY